MNKLISLAFLGAGIVAIVYGVRASDSIASSFSRLFTGAPTDNAIWLLVGGGIAALVGAAGMLRGSKLNG
jgi:hypothetical protein